MMPLGICFSGIFLLIGFTLIFFKKELPFIFAGLWVLQFNALFLLFWLQSNQNVLASATELWPLVALFLLEIIASMVFQLKYIQIKRSWVLDEYQEGESLTAFGCAALS